MDHWGDPWADDADNTTPLPKREEVAATTEPLSPPSTLSHAPVLLNGFLDDAQWGSTEHNEAFGGWGTSPKPISPIRADTHVADLDIASINNETPDRPIDDANLPERTLDDLEDEGWGELETADSIKDGDNVVSESSDSATTVQPEDLPDEIPVEAKETLLHPDDSSTRSSTSPSEISHTEAPSESPRTSFEDERTRNSSTPIIATKPQAEIEVIEEKVDSGLSSTEVQQEDVEELNESSPETLEDHAEDGNASLANEDNVVHEIKEENPVDKGIVEAEEVVVAAPLNIPGLDLDPALFTELFQPITSLKALPTPADDPVHSTSARKAWYRLTRKQTMREFKNGNDDDNHVRVTWKQSHVRSEVNKIVARWATEDRLSGRGPTAGANFFWDTPKQDVHKPVSHTRRKSSITATSPIQVKDKKLAQLKTEAPAAFDWSSPVNSHDIWKIESPTAKVGSPTVSIGSRIASPQEQSFRSTSIDLVARSFDTSKAPSHQASTAEPSRRSLTNAQQPAQAPFEADPWADLGALETDANKLVTQPETSSVSAKKEDADDDEEWGEMVESPVVSMFTPIEPFTPNASRNPTLSTPASTPKSAQTSPFQATQTSKHASPIVRLKGVVSPTSALFKYNSFVPNDIEQGPIGPGLLRPSSSKGAKAHSDVNQEIPTPPQTNEPNKEPEDASHLDSKNESLIVESVPTSETDVVESMEMNGSGQKEANITTSPTTQIEHATFEPSPSPPTQKAPAEDPWSDADFSFFESAPPAPQHTQRRSASSADPFSLFESPPPAPYTRPPTKSVTPPPIQPLTGATNTAQRRKAEEDEIIRSIVRGLPDLSYMLQR